MQCLAHYSFDQRENQAVFWKHQAERYEARLLEMKEAPTERISGSLHVGRRRLYEGMLGEGQGGAAGCEKMKQLFAGVELQDELEAKREEVLAAA